MPPPSPQRGFDRISPFYDALAGLFPGGWIQRSQRLHLGNIAGCRKVLIVGGGNGGFLRSLLESGFRGHVVYLDISQKMIQRARRKAAGLGHARVDYRRADVNAPGPTGVLGGDERFDLICTHYVLDVFPPSDLESVMQRLDRALEPGGLWLCTDFSPPGGGLLRRWSQRGLLRMLYAFFGRVCGVRTRQLPPIDSAFARHGYITKKRRDVARGFLWSALYRKPDAPAQAIRSRVTADNEAHPQSAMATSNSWRSNSSTRVTPA